MPKPFTPKPPPEPKTTVGMAVTLPELKRLHTLADQRSVSISQLLRHAIERAYPDDTTT